MKVLTATIAYLAMALCIANAETYPNRAITIVVPFAAGGAVDVMARLFAAKIGDNIGQPVIVENRGGGSGTIGIGAVASAPPDGYKILYSPNTAAILPALYRNLPFSSEKDLLPISQAITSTLVLVVHPKVQANNLQELISLAKSQPGKLNFGSAGVADPLQLGIEMVKNETGIKVEAIPYKGQGPLFTALLAGEVDMGIVSLQTALPSIESGLLKPLGITSAKRSKALPTVPTIAEAGVPGYSLDSWHGFFAPVRTPPEIIDRLNREIVRAVNLPDLKDRIETVGNEVVASSPKDFATQFKSDVEKFKKVAKDANLQLQD